MTCEKCGREINNDPTFLKGEVCPDCGRYLCNDCADWEVSISGDICAECASKGGQNAEL